MELSALGYPPIPAIMSAMAELWEKAQLPSLFTKRLDCRFEPRPRRLAKVELSPCVFAKACATRYQRTGQR